MGAVLVVFWGRGAFTYAQDVAVIESEMVATAKWVSVNVPPGALVAAHDIGALGYFGGHELVDLAGLISPEVIPFLRDENRIATYMTGRGVSYLVAFPDWYPTLTSHLLPVFTTGAPYAPAQGGTEYDGVPVAGSMKRNGLIAALVDLCYTLVNEPVPKSPN